MRGRVVAARAAAADLMMMVHAQQQHSKQPPPPQKNKQTKRKVNEAKANAAEGVAELRQAYEFTLDTIGSDIGAGHLWLDYVGFLAAPKAGSAAYAALWSTTMVAGQEEGTRTAALR